MDLEVSRELFELEPRAIESHVFIVLEENVEFFRVDFDRFVEVGACFECGLGRGKRGIDGGGSPECGLFMVVLDDALVEVDGLRHLHANYYFILALPTI